MASQPKHDHDMFPLENTAFFIATRFLFYVALTIIYKPHEDRAVDFPNPQQETICITGYNFYLQFDAVENHDCV